jgi:hypothetical protein
MDKLVDRVMNGEIKYTFRTENLHQTVPILLRGGTLAYSMYQSTGREKGESKFVRQKNKPPMPKDDGSFLSRRFGGTACTARSINLFGYSTKTS